MGEPMHEPTADEIRELARAMGSEQWAPDWLNYWHEREASACWIKIDYPKLARDAFLAVLTIVEERERNR